MLQQTKIPIALASNNPPDVFQEWGGGALVDEVKANKVAEHHQVRRAVDQDDRRLGGRLAGERPAVRRSVQRRRCGVLVQQRPLQAGRDHVDTDDLAAVHGRDRQAEGGEHHPDLRRRQGSLAGRLLLGLSRHEALQQDDDAAVGGDLQLHGRVLAEGGHLRAAAPRREALPGRLPGNTRAAGADELGGPARERQGRHGAAGSLEPQRDAAADAGQQGPELPRLVPVPEHPRQQGHAWLAARRR